MIFVACAAKVTTSDPATVSTGRNSTPSAGTSTESAAVSATSQRTGPNRRTIGGVRRAATSEPTAPAAATGIRPVSDASASPWL